MVKIRSAVEDEFIRREETVMTINRSILALSLAPVLISVLGTILTLVCFRYRSQIAKCYFRLRSRWHESRKSWPDWVIYVIRAVLGTVGIGMVGMGLILIPLPGPGSLLVLAGAGLLDLEFGWIIPALNKFIDYCPERWEPDALRNGLEKLQDGTNTRTTGT